MGFNLTRRKLVRFLVKGGLFFIGVFSLFRFLFFKKEKKKELLEIEGMSPVGDGALVILDKKIAVVEIDGKLIGLSLICPHLGCTVKVDTKKIRCPCHGSVFSHTGKIISGPANRDLKRYKVKIKGKKIILT